MANFNNSEYKYLVKDLIGDIFYLEKISIGSKISIIRKYAEVVIRKYLNIQSDKQITLGNKSIIKELEKKSNNNELLITSVEYIRNIGNKNTHTQSPSTPSENDLKLAVEKLFNLYSFLMIDFFERYGFGENMQIVKNFSILPPIVRYITLNYLFSKNPENVEIIDRLCLATLKAYDEETALTWLRNHESKLSNMPCATEEAKNNLIEKLGPNVASMVIKKTNNNMYDMCINKLKHVSTIINKKGRLYSDFEGAQNLYKKEGILMGDTPDIIEFNSIMEFLFLGRKNNQRIEEKDLYNFISIETNF